MTEERFNQLDLMRQDGSIANDIASFNELQAFDRSLRRIAIGINLSNSSLTPNEAKKKVNKLKYDDLVKLALENQNATFDESTTKYLEDWKI